MPSANEVGPPRVPSRRSSPGSPTLLALSSFQSVAVWNPVDPSMLLPTATLLLLMANRRPLTPPLIQPASIISLCCHRPSLFRSRHTNGRDWLEEICACPTTTPLSFTPHA